MFHINTDPDLLLKLKDRPQLWCGQVAEPEITADYLPRRTQTKGANKVVRPD